MLTSMLLEGGVAGRTAAAPGAYLELTATRHATDSHHHSRNAIIHISYNSDRYTGLWDGIEKKVRFVECSARVREPTIKNKTQRACEHALCGHILSLRT